MQKGRYYDSFGYEAAWDDLERLQDNDEEFFVHTDAIRNYLKRGQTQPFIAGPKGSGKSLLLFKRLLLVRAHAGVVIAPAAPQKAFSPSNDFSSAPHWVLANDPNNPPIVHLSRLWEWALYQTTLSAWYRHARLTNEREGWFDALAELCERRERADPFQLVTAALDRIDAGAPTRRGRIELPRVDPLRNFVTEHAPRLPPAYVFIDNYDDAFETSPDLWIDNAQAAFQAIQRIHEFTGRRLHYVMTLRSEVVTRLRESEHFPKWGQDLFQITWRDDELRSMFTRRASHLRRDLLAAPQHADRDPMLSLFGEEFRSAGSGRVVIHNVGAETNEALTEPIEGYLLRHSLRRPRDLILLGNHLLNHTGADPEATREAQVRDAVDAAARVIRDGYLAEIAGRWPWKSESLSAKAFIQRYIRSNVITLRESQEIARSFEEDVARSGKPDTGGLRSNPIRLLVSYGLLGYPVRERSGNGWSQHFVRVDAAGTAAPEDADFYLVHPVLYGEPFHIAPVGGQVVGPGLPFEAGKLALQRSVANGRRRPSDPPRTVDVFRWIHLSDLHFGAGPIGHRFDQGAVMEAICEDISQKGPHKPDAIFVTGDVAFRASKGEYALAAQGLRRIAESAGVPIERLYLVPGNHDVDRKVAGRPVSQDIHRAVRDAPEQLDERLVDKDARKILSAKLKPWMSFLRDLSPLHRQTLRAQGLDWSHALTLNGEGYKVRIVGLSTVWASDAADGRPSIAQHEPFVRNLVLSPGQVARHVNAAAPDELVVLLTHHPPEWLHADAAQMLSTTLARRPHIHFCGHVHSASARSQMRFGARWESPRYVAGAGHGEPGESDHSYSWGAVRWNETEGCWQTGWAPRVYAAETHAMYPDRERLDDEGYAWASLSLPWASPVK